MQFQFTIGTAFETLIHIWSLSFFIEPTLIIFFVISLIVALFHHRRNKVRLYFLFYFLVGVIGFSGTDIIEVFKLLNGTRLAKVNEHANTAFELAEFLAFYHFFKECLVNKRLAIVGRVAFASFCLIILLFTIEVSIGDLTPDEINKHSIFVNVAEFFCLAMLCLIYFYELLTCPPTFELFLRPSFFIATAAFFYSILTIPFFMLSQDIINAGGKIYRVFYGCHYLLLLILVTSLLRAFSKEISLTA